MIHAADYINPLPPVLMLTAIVVSVATFGVAMALAADVTRPERRSVVMAVIGMGIGASFLVSMMISVPVSTVLGLGGMFWLTAAFAVAGILPEHAVRCQAVRW